MLFYKQPIFAALVALLILGGIPRRSNAQDHGRWLSQLADPNPNIARPELSYTSHAIQFLWRNRSELSPDQQLRLIELQEQSMAFLTRRRQIERQLGFGPPKTAEQREASLAMGQLFQEWDAFRKTALDESIQMMGDHVDEFVQSLNVNTIRGMMRRAVRQLGNDQIDQFKLGPEFLLQLKSFLGLNAVQERRLKSLVETLSEGKESAQKTIRERLRELQLAQLDEMLDVLDADQRERFLKVFGEPIEWPIWPNDRRVRDSVELEAAIAGRDMSLRGANAVLPRSVLDLLRAGDRQALEEREYEIEDRFVWEMLGNPETCRELELSEDQINEIRTETQALYRRDKRIVTDRFGQQRLTDLFAGRAEIPSGLESRLLKHQRAIFLQVELQTRLFRHWSSLTMLSPEMRLFLNLSSDQQTTLTRIQGDYASQVADVWKDARRRIYDQLDEQRETLMRILTDSQREQLEALLELVQESN